jgi:hypothetical protein
VKIEPAPPCSAQSSHVSRQAILTAEVDPCSACYVRFYHENFHRDKPDLLSQIKRATKGDQQSKDDVESLRIKIYDLKDALRSASCEYDRKIADLTHEWEHRFSVMKAEHEKLAAALQRALDHNLIGAPQGFASGRGAGGGAKKQQSRNSVTMPPPLLQSAQVKPPNTDLLHSLSEAAVSLGDKNSRSQGESGEKRSAPENGDVAGSNKKRPAARTKKGKDERSMDI